MQDFKCSLLESCKTSSAQSEMLCPGAHASPWNGTATSYIVTPFVSYTRRTAPSSLVLTLCTKSLWWNFPVIAFITSTACSQICGNTTKYVALMPVRNWIKWKRELGKYRSEERRVGKEC